MFFSGHGRVSVGQPGRVYMHQLCKKKVDAVKKTYQEQGMIGMNGKRELGNPVLLVQLDEGGDDDVSSGSIEQQPYIVC